MKIMLWYMFIFCAMIPRMLWAETTKNSWDEVTILGNRIEDATLPGSGDRVDTDHIRMHSYDDINEILRQVPGIYLREEDGFGLFPNLSLRGVDPGRSQKVTILEDGITMNPAPYSAPSAYYSPTAGRMSAIEVLKGSSQVRFGPHSTGGVVNYISTAIPTHNKFYSKSLFGTDNEIRNHTFAGGAMKTEKGTIGILLEHYYRKNDGFKTIDPTPDFPDGNKTGFIKTEPMLKIAWEAPSESAKFQKVEAKFGYTDLIAQETYLGLSEVDFSNNPYRRYSATRFDEIDSEQARSYLRYLIEVSDNVMFSLTGYYNQFQRNWRKLHDIGGGDFSNISQALAAGGTSLAIIKGEAAGTLNVRNNNRSYDQYGYEGSSNIDFHLGDSAHELEVGIGYHADRVRRLQNTESFTQDSSGAITSSSVSAFGTAGNRRQQSQAVRSFIRDTMTWGPVTFSPGFRYEYIDFEYVDFNTSGNFNSITARGDNILNATAGGVGATFEISEDASIFGGIHQGFSVPGPRDNVRNNLMEESSLTGEIGLRFNHLGILKTELVYFHTDFDDLIVTDNIGGSGSGNTENVGDIISQGVELKTQLDAGRAWKKDFSNPYYFVLTYTNSVLDGDSNSTDPESIFSGGQDGAQVPYVPELQFALGTGLEIGQFGLFVDATYVGETFTTASNAELQVRPDGSPDARFGKTDDYFVFDISGHIKINQNAKITANLQNVGDIDYIVSRHPHGPRPGRPFSFLAGVELIF